MFFITSLFLQWSNGAGLDPGVGAGASPGGKNRFRRRGRKRELAFLEDIEDLLDEEQISDEEQDDIADTSERESTQQNVRAEAARRADEKKALRLLSNAYQTSLDSIQSARALIEERKRELPIEDEMAMMIVLMAGLSDDQ